MKEFSTGMTGMNWKKSRAQLLALLAKVSAASGPFAGEVEIGYATLHDSDTLSCKALDEKRMRLTSHVWITRWKCLKASLDKII